MVHAHDHMFKLRTYLQTYTHDIIHVLKPRHGGQVVIDQLGDSGVR